MWPVTKTTMALSTSKPPRRAAAWRSGLEDTIQRDLTQRGVPFEYEALKIAYSLPATDHKYTPDFHLLSNGIIVEGKGLWDLKDRQKHAAIREQHPDLDIRMVFTRSASPIRKGSKTTYADVCRKLGIPFSDKLIPTAWALEPDCPSRRAALEGALSPPKRKANGKDQP
jgi:hypothetical protein